MYLRFAFAIFVALFCAINGQTTAPIFYTNCTLNGFKDWLTFDNQSCYYLSLYSERLTWHDANVACQAKGAQLASIHDLQTNQYFANLTRVYYSYYYYNMMYWIGLNALVQRGYYRWSDGSSYNFGRYAYSGMENGIPAQKVTTDSYSQGRCIYLYALYTSGVNYAYWYYEDCNTLHNYICQKNLYPTTVATTTPTPPGHCAKGWIEYADEKCIKLVNISKTYSAAQRYCDDQSAELLAIHSLTEQSFITALIDGLPSQFIGLFKSTSTYRWSWSDQSNLSYTNWVANTLSSYRYSCGVILTNEVQAGQWQTVECDSVHPIICQKRKDARNTIAPQRAFGECTLFPEVSSFVQFRNSCYYVSDELKSWDDADRDCQQFNGAHLTSIENGFEYAFLMYITRQFAKLDKFWLGFYSLPVDGLNTSQLFEWVDDWPNYFTRWDDNEPRFNAKGEKQCVYKNKVNGTWRTEDCNAKNGYICKKTKDEVIHRNDNSVGSCPKLITSDPKQVWTDVDKRSPYCYWFSMDMLYNEGMVTWADASFHCKQRNATLVSIHSIHELMLMKNKISKSKYNTWIGLFQLPGGDYAWEDHSAVDFTNWDWNYDDRDDYFYEYDYRSQAETSDLCVEIQSTDLLWHKTACTGYSARNKFYICQVPKIYTERSALRSELMDSMSGGSKAAIAISVLLVVAIVFGVVYAVRKYNITVSSISSFDNNLYSNRREQSSKANGATNVTDEPKVSFTKIDSNLAFHESSA